MRNYQHFSEISMLFHTSVTGLGNYFHDSGMSRGESNRAELCSAYVI
jgi:hypothetical protein